ncbi:Structure-specific endonuclease subunit SLX1-like protein [Diplonema papillatum]|nr:Structure-specific endonuclease subunit SLX1-like protein [Diplonema papillatum]
MADTGFYAVYLLESAHPRYTGHGYVGFTVDPERRLRQHNGDIQNGAGETRRKRPWAMVLCVHGFPTKTSALQFEWALQHPARSRSIRDAVYTNGPAPRKLADTLKKSACHIHLLHWALQSAPWKDHALTVHVFGDQQEKYAGYLTDPAYRLPAGVPPSFNEGAVTVQIGDWAALHRHRKFVRESEVAEEFDPSNSCSICETPVLSNTQLRCVSDECRLVAHPKCLARSFREAEPPLGPACSGTPSLIPRLPAPCPSCSVELTWPAVLGRSKSSPRPGGRCRNSRRRPPCASCPHPTMRCWIASSRSTARDR